MFMKEHRLRVIETRIMRKLFGPKREKVTWYCGKMHNGELCDLYYSPNTISVIKRKMRFAGDVAQMQEDRNANRVVVMEPETKRPLGKCRHRHECILKQILKNLDRLDSSGSGWDKWQTPVNTVNETVDSIKCTNLSTVCLSEPQHLSLQLKVCSFSFPHSIF